MKNLKLGNKFLVTFGLIILLYCIVIVTSLGGLLYSDSKFQGFYEDGYHITNQTMDMRRLTQTIAKNIGYATMISDPQQTLSYIDTAKINTTQLIDEISLLQQNSHLDTALVNRLEKILKDSVTLQDDVFQYAKQNKFEEAANIYFNEYNPYLLQVQDLLIQINESAQENAENSYMSSRSMTKSIIAALFFLSVFTLFVIVTMALSITRNLKKPLEEMEKAAKEMAKGSLKVNISYQSKDEFGSLADSMRTLVYGISNIVEDIGYVLGAMAKGDFTKDTCAEQNYIGDYTPILESIRHISNSLNSTMIQINQSAEQVAIGSKQVAIGAQTLSQGSTQQASSIEQLAATINEISYQIKKNAEDAQQAKEKSEKAGGEVVQSNQKMENMILAMKNISDKSSEIEKIIKVIEDIAFQTNILALNAAVEAARAGTAGKGFAVVADEVRNLASKSAQAAKNTTALIQESLNAVEEGTQIVDETAQTMLGVVEGAGQVNILIDKIATSSKDQSSSISQITEEIDQISSVIQTNSATAQQSAASSEELSGQSQILNRLVGKFTLKQQLNTI